jgi:hypothetical protein
MKRIIALPAPLLLLSLSTTGCSLFSSLSGGGTAGHPVSHRDDDCARVAEDAAKYREAEDWTKLRGRLFRWPQCRDALTRSGGDVATTQQAMAPEYDAYAQHWLAAYETQSSAGRFSESEQARLSFQEGLKLYRKGVPDASAPDALAQRFEGVKASTASARHEGSKKEMCAKAASRYAQLFTHDGKHYDARALQKRCEADGDAETNTKAVWCYATMVGYGEPGFDSSKICPLEPASTWIVEAASGDGVDMRKAARQAETEHEALKKMPLCDQAADTVALMFFFADHGDAIGDAARVDAGTKPMKAAFTRSCHQRHDEQKRRSALECYARGKLSEKCPDEPAESWYKAYRSASKLSRR